MQYLLYILFIVVAFFGMFAHFIKKNIKGETATEIRAYFHDNFRTTLVAAIATILGFLLLVATDAITTSNIVGSCLSAFAAGYGCDSGFNKWEGKGEQAGG